MRYEKNDRSLYDPEFPGDEEEESEPEIELTREERRWIALGALKSTLLIALLYIIAGALLIWLMLAIWT